MPNEMSELSLVVQRALASASLARSLVVHWNPARGNKTLAHFGFCLL
jgi:hypothetical protein